MTKKRRAGLPVSSGLHIGLLCMLFCIVSYLCNQVTHKTDLETIGTYTPCLQGYLTSYIIIKNMRTITRSYHKVLMFFAPEMQTKNLSGIGHKGISPTNPLYVDGTKTITIVAVYQKMYVCILLFNHRNNNDHL